MVSPISNLSFPSFNKEGASRFFVPFPFFDSISAKTPTGVIKKVGTLRFVQEG